MNYKVIAFIWSFSVFAMCEKKSLEKFTLFDQLTHDLQDKILFHVAEDTEAKVDTIKALYALSATCKKWNEIVQADYFNDRLFNYLQIRSGKKLLYKDEPQNELLRLAVLLDEIFLVHYLYKKTKHIAGEWGWTLLHWAANTNSLQSAYFLIKKGEDVNAKDKFGHTPFWFACRRDSFNVCKLLLQHDASFTRAEDSVFSDETLLNHQWKKEKKEGALEVLNIMFPKKDNSLWTFFKNKFFK